MKTLLTGGTGYIGSAVLEALVAAGHDVHAVVRSERAAHRVATAGAVPAWVDLRDVDAVSAALASMDGAVHAAAPADGADELNATVVDAAIRAFGDGRARLVFTSGVWIRGSGRDLDEDGTLDRAPDLVAWRVPIEERLLDSGVDAAVIEPGVVYGRGRGLVRLIADGPRTPGGAMRLIGDGGQHWSLVHVDDLARLYLMVLEHERPPRRVIASDGAPTTVRAIAEAIAGPGRVVPEPPDVTRERLGSAFADALMLDQVASGARARAIGWQPEVERVLDDLVRDRPAA
ncbi:NAD-dependent epimerase/dehydratase family protein [Agromyces kandeliae]|uniref:NAD-dependent epimerase/dehydratase family protein n=1 Tax=Agromyces kandeliae TaxID=2666141 RepID=A0A6L5R1G5_9MICO|nr:NAD-dependent epimerase/dehydratase family protein [Agromyces kandeliae]MRX43404.1 NAD-dependent epimerase/dehydratase family protein [Agromyces kandeliae]